MSVAVVLLLTLATSANAQNCRNERPCADMVPDLARATCTVTKITDGDTIRCAEYRKGVRLLLIDAPERDQGPHGALAKGALEQLLPVGTSARLEFDIQPTDRYGRILAYVWREDGALINEELARGGYAVTLTYPPNVKYVDRVRAAAEAARAEKRGLWGGSAFECMPKEHRARKC